MNPDINESFAPIFEKSKQSDVFWEELAILSFTGSVLERLKTLGLSKMELADRLRSSPAYVTKLLNGRNNFTLRTMVRVARLLKSEVYIELRAAVARSQSAPYALAQEVSPVRGIDSVPAADHAELALAA
jgi:transcriptional regulator with XRE-family HTH domain